MEILSTVLMIAAVVVIIVVLLKIISTPIRWIFKLLINAALGFVVLFLLNFFGGFIGISVGFTLLNALIVGFLGVPGVLLLVILSLFGTFF